MGHINAWTKDCLITPRAVLSLGSTAKTSVDKKLHKGSLNLARWHLASHLHMCSLCDCKILQLVDGKGAFAHPTCIQLDQQTALKCDQKQKQPRGRRENSIRSLPSLAAAASEWIFLFSSLRFDFKLPSDVDSVELCFCGWLVNFGATGRCFRAGFQ